VRVRDAARPVGTGRGTRRARLVRGEGRGVSTSYEGGGGVRRYGLRARPLSVVSVVRHGRFQDTQRPRRIAQRERPSPGPDRLRRGGDGERRSGDGAARDGVALRRPGLRLPVLTPPPRTKWTRRVPHPVLIGHAASLTPYRLGRYSGKLMQPQPLTPAVREIRAALAALLGVCFDGVLVPPRPPRRPVSTGRRTRRVQLVRGEGRDVSSQCRKGGGTPQAGRRSVVG